MSSGIATARTYERRRPEDSVLHFVVRDHLETFLEQLDAAVRLEPGAARLRAARGRVRQRAGREVGAVEDYRAALAQDERAPASCAEEQRSQRQHEPALSTGCA